MPVACGMWSDVDGDKPGRRGVVFPDWASVTMAWSVAGPAQFLAPARLPGTDGSHY